MTFDQKLKLYTLGNIEKLPQYNILTDEMKEGLRVVGNILPFRVNNYVTEELIDWDNVETDPIFRLTFMDKLMLSSEQYNKMNAALNHEHSSPADIKTIANEIRAELNPHPAGQLSANVPTMDNEPVPGLQHKYRETALIFPSQGQQCHSYCTFCFRWPQFIGDATLKFATDQAKTFVKYLREHKEITDVLITGGDPMMMNSRTLGLYIEPLLAEGMEHIQNIRIGSKSLSYWPSKFVNDADAENILALFKKVVDSGKHLAFMAHLNHWKEITTDTAHQAIANIRSTGAVIRTQSPIIKHINDDAEVWSKMWKEQVRLGMIPYYMFVERDTGPSHYFGLSLERALDIYQTAIRNVSGLARTVRGPSMSAHPGKVCIEGICEINGEKAFILNMLQSRDPELVKAPFFAKFDDKAEWLGDLEPAFNTKFPFES
ncbi:lysine 2,3-aminomutase [Halobacteriovorax marinus]|uniref:Lysine 2,3-aminomutase n=1 Tax=Halobacteriovorax marinus TaxID=97084 RepID=A0A1Y5F7D3_9BACT|nr:lysine 2,3-aminomutase [Halobacteriovorax marinus]